MKKRQELVATKISSEAWLRLNDIAKRMGLTSYRLIQEVVDTLILYMDEGRQLDPDMQMVIDCFERFEGWGELCRLTDVNVNWAVADCVYFLHDDRHKNAFAGVTACWNKKAMMTNANYTFNKKDILDMVVRRLFPDLYRELQLLAMQSGTNCTLDTIKHCIHCMLDDPDKATLRELFADCARTDYGRPAELTKYIRHNRKSIDTLEKQKKKKPVQLDLFEQEPKQEEDTWEEDKNTED